MEKYAFIPSRTGESETLEDLKKYLTGAGFDVKVLIGKSSIFDAYSDAVKDFGILATDHVIMCHDDIQILNDVDSFNRVLDLHFNHPKSGFLGVAGSKSLPAHCVWWGNYGPTHTPGHPTNHLSGAVFHGKNLETMSLDMYGRYARTVVLDGVFLAATGALLNSIQLKKPSSFPSGWHFYDIFYTYQAFRKGFINVTAPILLRHKSGGNPSGTFDDNRQAFISKFEPELPATTIG